VCTVLLVAMYCGQELCESLFAPGHPVGLAGVFGHGGWIALPAAAAVGAALATALRVTQTLIELAALSHAARARVRPAQLRRPAPAISDWRLEPRSGVAAGRAPPPFYCLQ
jgi:hypothetical protein